MTTASRKRKHQPSSCPPGSHPAGHRIPFTPTFKQAQYCRRAIGISRFVYNLCVATHSFCRTNRLRWPSWQDLNKEINAAKREDFPFLTQVNHRVAEGAVRDFGLALKNWRDPDHSAGPPTFHKKRLTGSGSFRAAAGIRDIHYNGKRRLHLPALGSLKLAHTLPKGIIYEAHISYRNGQWILSINYWKKPSEKPDPDTRVPQGAVDTGINPLATDSEGHTWENPKSYYKSERKLARWQRAQARRTKGSHGWWEAQHRIDRLQRRIKGLRQNSQHQMTSELVNKFQHIVIEDLNVAGMMQGRTPKAQADAGMGEIKRQLLYKAHWKYCTITLAHRFFPSSKTCCNCGSVNAKLKRDRFWQCPDCNQHHERNLNAAVNLRNLLTLPADSGVTLRDGKALAAGDPGGETIPLDRRTAPLSMRAPPTVNR